jgi:hypothetical protein
MIKDKIVVETEIRKGCRIYRPASFQVARSPAG